MDRIGRRDTALKIVNLLVLQRGCCAAASKLTYSQLFITLAILSVYLFSGLLYYENQSRIFISI
jgi:hypothetical protein